MRSNWEVVASMPGHYWFVSFPSVQAANRMANDYNKRNGRIIAEVRQAVHK